MLRRPPTIAPGSDVAIPSSHRPEYVHPAVGAWWIAGSDAARIHVRGTSEDQVLRLFAIEYDDSLPESSSLKLGEALRESFDDNQGV